MERETYFDGTSYTALSSKSECVQALGIYEDIGTASEFRTLKEAEQKRRIQTISLDAIIHGTGNLTLMDVVAG